VDVVGEPVEQRAGEALGAEHACPLVEGQVAGDDGRAALVSLREHLWDYYKVRATIPAAEAWRPLDQGECPLVKK
jgi:hypothetical protein